MLIKSEVENSFTENSVVVSINNIAILLKSIPELEFGTLRLFHTTIVGLIRRHGKLRAKVGDTEVHAAQYK